MLLLVSCAPQLQTGVFLEGTFEIPDDLVTADVPVDEMRYVVRFPAGFEPGGDLPVVVFLHGSGDDDYDTRWLTSYGLPAVVRFDELPTDRPFVLLAPRAAPGTSWDRGRQPETVVALLDDVVSTYDLASSPVVLTGLSMGGYGAWHLATLFPGRFARVASVSGSGYGTTALPDGVDVCALAAVDLRAFHGSEDMISLPDRNLEVIELWEERCGAEVDFRLLDGLGHFEAFEQVYRDPAFYDWFLTG